MQRKRTDLSEKLVESIKTTCDAIENASRSCERQTEVLSLYCGIADALATASARRLREINPRLAKPRKLLAMLYLKEVEHYDPASPNGRKTHA